jgi:hypothetical protein
MGPHGLPVRTVRNEVPSEKVLAGTLFLTVISTGNLGEPYFLRIRR